MKLTILTSGALCCVLAVTVALTHRVLTHAPSAKVELVDLRSAEAKAAAAKLACGDNFYARANYREAKRTYEELVENYKDSLDPQTQDEVGIARLRLGYLAARTDGYLEAKKYFDEAAREYRGTAYLSPDFGGLKDQAAYQSCVCASASNPRITEHAFLKFIKKYPYSPLIHAAFRRLIRFNHGKPKPEYEITLQHAVALQEQRIKFETSVCGPKVIEQLLTRTGAPHMSYEAIAKLAGTTNKGTTLEQMQKALDALGFVSTGWALNAEDFAKQSTPCIWLYGDRYLLVLAINDHRAHVFDPLYHAERDITIPTDSTFGATVLTIERR